MGGFFKGWRRKVGCSLLVMACVATGLWVRSYYLEDKAGLRLASQRYLLCGSLNEGLYCGTLLEEDDPHLPIRTFGFGTTEHDEGWERDPMDLWIPEYVPLARNINVFGFRFCSKVASDELPTTLTLWFIPHWMIGIPLTLVSAFLILWKPRKAK